VLGSLTCSSSSRSQLSALRVHASSCLALVQLLHQFSIPNFFLPLKDSHVIEDAGKSWVCS
jgi:hypothetical protein